MPDKCTLYGRFFKQKGIKSLNVENWLLFAPPIKVFGYTPGGVLKQSHYSALIERVLLRTQWRIKGGADWATARGTQHLGDSQFLCPQKSVG